MHSMCFTWKVLEFMDKHSDSDVRTFEASLRALGRMAAEHKGIVEDHRTSELDA